MMLSTFSPKTGQWSLIHVAAICQQWETQNFGWAVVLMPAGDRKIVCLG